jgi:hypothetical protein
MFNGKSVLFGTTTVLIKSKSWTTTEELKMTESLDEIHPGKILLEDFMKPMGITARQLSLTLMCRPAESAIWSMATAP